MKKQSYTKLLKLFLFGVFLFFWQVEVLAQKEQTTPIGHPVQVTASQMKQLFANPPIGYGEVPFFWWMGDTLTREHLTWQLDLLAKKKVSSLQINYAHSDKGGPNWGLTFPSKPALFTDEWWNLFGWFMKEAKKRKMTVSLSDYTLGVGQGSYVDDALAANPGLSGAELKFEQILFSGKLSLLLQPNTLAIVAYKGDKSVDLRSYISDNCIEWEAPEGEWQVGMVYRTDKKTSYDPMNPIAGKAYVEHFFQRFEDKFPMESKGGLNFFFSDELNFNLQGFLWNDIFQAEFKKRKGYDIVSFLPELFMDIGTTFVKTRLDYNEVMVSLCEEHFFKPVYDWHQKRGLIYGCDHGGRGRDVVEFGDYFRTQRWNQAPGCDQPRLGKDIIKNKVASSIAHLYERPRVWLEGFYSSGWGTSSAELMDAIYANFAMGQNLLSLHGLYYSTPGGWWEWAPPCNHFRMPYWEQMGGLLECTERMSFLFSQGKHRADVAILYPVEPVIAGYGKEAVSCAFSTGEYLYKQSVDFDFLDYESLARATIKDRSLHVAGESFKVLIVPSMKAIRHASLEKLLAFKQAGGMVLVVGELPEVTEMVNFKGKTVKSLADALVHDNPILQTPQEVLETIDKKVVRDFKILSLLDAAEEPYILHRSIAGNEMYAVYGVPKQTNCFFRSKGAVSLWNPWTGEIHSVAVSKVTDEGTYLRMPLDKTEMQILVFDSKSLATSEPEIKFSPIKTVCVLDKEWEFEVRPVLDNRYGDFHWPATQELMVPYVYSARYSQGFKGNEWIQPSFDDKTWSTQTFSYGEKFMLLETEQPLADTHLLQNLPDGTQGVTHLSWKPYEFSWRWGVQNDYGHQGYHGLKLEMNDNFIRLGDIQVEATEMKRIPKGNGMLNYYLYTTVYVPTAIECSVSSGEMKPEAVYLNGEKRGGDDRTLSLKQGVNTLILHYTSHGTTFYVLRKLGATNQMMPESVAEQPLAMSFRGDNTILPFSVQSPFVPQNSDQQTVHRFRFISAPGLRQLTFHSYGEARVWVNGVFCKMKEIKRQPNGAIWYQAQVVEPRQRVATVAIEVSEVQGFSGGAAIDGGVAQQCDKGLITLTDWSKIEGLASYSGSAWYRTTVNLKPRAGQKLFMDLGRVVSTAELWINGKKVGVRMTAPWRFDLTGFVTEGENKVEILVHNTAGNHYLSIPTNYRGSVEAGITGKVSILAEEQTNNRLDGERMQENVIWTDANADYKRQAYVVFRKSFQLNNIQSVMRMQLFANARYLLWINGQYVMRGPCRFHPQRPEFDDIDIRPYLCSGKNAVAILVHHYGNNVNGRIMKASPGLTVRVMSGENELLVTDESWQYSKNTCYLPASESWNTIFDKIDGRIDTGSWKEIDFDDSGWMHAQKTDGRLWGPLVPNEMPLPKEQKLIKMRSLPDGKDLETQLPFTLESGKDLLIDLGKMGLMYTQMELEAEEGCVVSMQYALRYKGGKAYEIFGEGNQYTTRKGIQQFMTTDQAGCRYMRVKSTGGSIRIRKIQMTERSFPFERLGSFSCSDSLLTALWNMAINTIQATSDDAYGSDARERNEWIQDGVKASFFCSRVALASQKNKNKSEMTLLKNILRHAALSQLPDGRFLATYPTDRGAEDCHYFIDDYACQWLEGLKLYIDMTNDINFLHEMWPALTAQLDWFRAQITSRGLYLCREYMSFDNPFAYITCEGATINAYIYQAFCHGYALADLIGEKEKFSIYKQLSEQLYKAYNTQYWNEKEKAYNAAYWNEKVYSPTVHAQLMALYSGLVPADRLSDTRSWFLKYYKNKGMNHCCVNFDTEKMVTNRSGINMPIVYFWAFNELYKMNAEKYDQEAIDEMKRRWRYMVELQQDAGTLSESFVDEKGTGSDESCHNYGTVPAYYLSSYVLGVRVESPVIQKKILIEPRLGNLTYASGNVVTVHGTVPIEWKKTINGKELRFCFTVPEGIQAELRIPIGNSFTKLILNGEQVVLSTENKTIRQEGRWLIIKNVEAKCCGFIEL